MSTARAPWILTVLTALATFFSMFALSTIVEGAAWLRTVTFVLLVVMGVDLAVRAVSRSRLLPTAAALITAVIVMVPLFGIDEAGERAVRLSGLWRALTAGAEYAASSPAPAEATSELVALLTAFAVSIFIVADHLAASWRAVAVSGIVLILPWTPAIFLQYQVPMWALFATAACWMIAMGAARSQVVTHRNAPLTGAALATCAALLATVLVVPAALGANGWGSIPRFNAPDSLETSTRLNLALDLRNSLTVNSEQVVMTYVSTGQHPDTLRLYTFRDFDGSQWTREKADPTDSEPAGDGVLWPSQVDGWNDMDRQILSIQVTHLAERNLPMPTVPRSVEVDNSWTYSPSRDEATTSGSGTKNMQYSVVTALGYFTAEALQDAQAAIDAGEDQVSPAYTEVPSSVDLSRIQSLSASIAADAGATTQFEKAVAIQNYLRDSANFTYDTSVSPDVGGDAVSKFLDDRRGYCVQFATTMVMMARSMGIPSRLGMGFLGGQLGDDGVWNVRSGDAHAWPELYFPGEGWVRFEPTPAVQTGSAPSYTVERSDSGNAPIPTNVPIPTTAPTVPDQTANPNPTTTANPGGSGIVSWWMVIALVVIAAGTAAAVWLLRSRSAARSADHGPEAAWASLREQLPEGMRWSQSLTPLEAAERLDHDVRATGAPFSEEAERSLTRLRDAVSDHRYAPPTQDAPTTEWLQLQVTRVAEEANAATRSRPDRVDARSAPRRDS